MKKYTTVEYADHVDFSGEPLLPEDEFKRINELPTAHCIVERLEARMTEREITLFREMLNKLYKHAYTHQLDPHKVDIAFMLDFFNIKDLAYRLPSVQTYLLVDACKAIALNAMSQRIQDASRRNLKAVIA